ncbi:TetR/AcrR family transcriptional regulator [Kineococcus endophyticus]|uniref:TetR/AcrR family transcriptional regulator n=1 Tax=Kineococcus endophyticus TaxID=1181883 RepID=A0ABV3P2I9_9ACTN
MPGTPTSSSLSRGRLLDAMRSALREKPLRAVTVADVVRLARVSRRTFYEEFATREQCYIALLEQEDARMAANVRSAVDPAAPWRDQVRQAVDAYVETVSAEPAICLSWVRDLPVLGAPGVEVGTRSMDTVVSLLQNLSRSRAFGRDGLEPLDDATARLLAGGIEALTASVLERGDDLREVAPVLVRAAVALAQAPRDGG